MKWNFIAAVTLLSGCSIFATVHAADELEMLNGSKLSGKLVAEADDSITFNSGGAELKLDTALIRAITVDGTRRELTKIELNKDVKVKPVVGAKPNPLNQIPDQGPRTMADASPELRKELEAMLADAKKEAREKYNRAGTELALAKYPKMSPEMAALLRSEATQASWLKVVVDNAFAAASRAIPQAMKVPNVTFEYKAACTAIRELHEAYTNRSGAAFIDDYVSQAIKSSVGVLPPDKPADGKAPPKHLVHRIQDNSGITQLGGN